MHPSAVHEGLIKKLCIQIKTSYVFRIQFEILKVIDI